MLACRVHCERLAGQSLTARDAHVEFGADGVSGPLSEEVAEYLLGIPGFEAREAIEVGDGIQPVSLETPPAVEVEPEDPPVEEERINEESAFLRWYYANSAAERARFVEAENLKREELLRVLAEEEKNGNKHPGVLAAIARMLFALRRRFTREPEEEPSEEE